MSEYDALARTAQLVNADFFDGRADERAIVDELRATRVVVSADRRSATSHAGQTAVVALVQLLEMMGMSVDLAVPDVELAAPQPPLNGSRLRTALEEYAADLIPGARPTSTAELRFVVGDVPTDDRHAIRVWADAWRAQVGPVTDVPAAPISGTWPMGALAAAGAAAPEALRQILPRMAGKLGLPLPTRTYRFDSQKVALDLAIDGVAAGMGELGAVDFISGGAITTDALYSLLRVPALQGEVRVIEPEPLDLSNLNRYALGRRSLVGRTKIAVLAAASTNTLTISGVPVRFDDEHRHELGALAERVCVGVDDIPSRWTVQREWPAWLCVGATSHLEVRLSAHVDPGPCAGCAHPEDEPLDGDIPTISFVSYWAGLLQARELLAAISGKSPSAPIYWCSPFGLANEYGFTPWQLAPRRSCPVPCPASRALPGE